MSEYDADGNEIRRVGSVTEIVTPGPTLQAWLDAQRVKDDAFAAKVEANRVALNSLATDCRAIAMGGALPSDTVYKRKVCEMLARLWFHEKYDDS